MTSREGTRALVSRAAELEHRLARCHAELRRERQVFPSAGVWLVEELRGGRSECRIAQLGELPDPLAFAALARHRDAIAGAIAGCWQVYRERGRQAPLEVADAILRALDGALRERGQ